MRADDSKWVYFAWMWQLVILIGMYLIAFLLPFLAVISSVAIFILFYFILLRAFCFATVQWYRLMLYKLSLSLSLSFSWEPSKLHSCRMLSFDDDNDLFVLVICFFFEIFFLRSIIFFSVSWNHLIMPMIIWILILMIRFNVFFLLEFENVMRRTKGHLVDQFRMKKKENHLR